ncbi:MAG TPA: hypothetical protein VHI13_04215 [Candidatus Kapabacteria bacterium]|nr:hypothetical protein [Candidatus Kapabacteria bacterium]
MLLFSSDIERDAGFPSGLPDSIATGITGVGLVESAIGATRLIDRHAPSCLVFVGTCGAHAGSGIGVGDIVIATSIVLGSGDVARGEMRLPALLRSRLATDPALNARLAEGAGDLALRSASVSCTLGITETEKLARELSADAATENMEAFAVARAAEHASVPVAVLLGVTNIVGPGGGAGWAANYREMMQAVTGIAMRALS